jgi:hypothetical protein
LRLKYFATLRLQKVFWCIFFFQLLNKGSELQTELNQLKAYIEEVFTDYNGINEDTRAQIELINQSLAELHTDKKRIEKPRNRIGFIT